MFRFLWFMILLSLLIVSVTHCFKSPQSIKKFYQYKKEKRLKMSSFTNPLVMDDFCIRQFNNPSYTGTQVNYDIVQFENKVNEFYRNGSPLIDGYAPFW